MDGDEIVYHGYQDIGVAVSTDRGLVVPVLRDTDSMKLPTSNAPSSISVSVVVMASWAWTT
ncbi:hypothetical protein DK37_08640 [Halomonas sp. SUBG004]|nr:hypothetical protein DK37_08640 [Halomonas sp. SUBG004]